MFIEISGPFAAHKAVASNAFFFRGARISSLFRAPLKTPAWEAKKAGVPCSQADDNAEQGSREKFSVRLQVVTGFGISVDKK